jgi:hypothetical protein
MPEIFRTRDCGIFHKGPSITVEVPHNTAVSGWRGGQVFNWTDPGSDRLVATISDGIAGAVALWGSDESSDEYTSMTRNQPTYKYVVLGMGGWIFSTTSFEKYTYASRTGPGPLVPITYGGNDLLLISLRGYWTNEDEWTLSGDPRAPNGNYVGEVVQPPTPARNNQLTVHSVL